MKTVIMYGTFDLLHVGHIDAFMQAKEFAEGGKLIVGLSTDEFNAVKGKKAHMPYAVRKKFVEAIRCIDEVIPEENWGQKRDDIIKHKVDVLVMGADWEGQFNDLSDLCEVRYVPRRITISSTIIREHVEDIWEANEEAIHHKQES